MSIHDYTPIAVMQLIKLYTLTNLGQAENFTFSADLLQGKIYSPYLCQTSFNVPVQILRDPTSSTNYDQNERHRCCMY